jgi:hypothetical protein
VQVVLLVNSEVVICRVFADRRGRPWMPNKPWIAACVVSLVLAAAGLVAGPAWAGDADAPASTANNAEQAALNRELLSVEEEVDALKERVFRSKATLQLLKEVVMEGAGTGGKATIWHVNKLSQGFRLESLQYAIPRLIQAAAWMRRGSSRCRTASSRPDRTR